MPAEKEVGDKTFVEIFRVYLCDIYSFLEHHHHDNSYSLVFLLSPSLPFLHFHVITLHNRAKIVHSEREAPENNVLAIFSGCSMHIVKKKKLLMLLAYFFWKKKNLHSARKFLTHKKALNWKSLRGRLIIRVARSDSNLDNSFPSPWLIFLSEN